MKYKNYDLGTVGTKEYYRKTVEMHKDTLVGFRGNAVNENELEWEIRLYDYILEQPEVRYPQYQDARFDGDGIPVEKREVVKKLGWDVK